MRLHTRVDAIKRNSRLTDKIVESATENTIENPKTMADQQMKLQPVDIYQHADAKKKNNLESLIKRKRIVKEIYTPFMSCIMRVFKC